MNISILGFSPSFPPDVQWGIDTTPNTCVQETSKLGARGCVILQGLPRMETQPWPPLRFLTPSAWKVGVGSNAGRLRNSEVLQAAWYSEECTSEADTRPSCQNSHCRKHRLELRGGRGGRAYVGMWRKTCVSPLAAAAVLGWSGREAGLGSGIHLSVSAPDARSGGAGPLRWGH